MDLALRGLLDWNVLVRMTSTTPALVAGLKTKGMIKKGFDADLVVVDPISETVIQNDHIQSKCRWSPFDGSRLMGKIVSTIKAGNIL